MRLTQGWRLNAALLVAATVVGAQGVRAAPKPAQSSGQASPSSTAAEGAPAAPVQPVAPAAPEAAPSGALPTAEAKPAEEGPLGGVFPAIQGAAETLNLSRPEKFPVSMRVLVDTSVGAGTFMLNQRAKQPYVANTIRLSPSVAIWKSLRASMTLNVTKEWISSYTQSSTVPNQVMLQDLMMGVGMPQIYQEPNTGLGFGGGIWAFAPTSIQSRAETLLVGVRPWVSLTWSKWGFDVAYTASFRKNFHQYVNPSVDTRSGAFECADLAGRCFVSETEAGPAARADEGFLKHVGGDRILDLRRRNVSHQILQFASAGYTLFDQLTLSGMIVLINSFKYVNDPTQYTSPNAGNQWGHTDSIMGNVDLTWAPFEHVAFSTGTFTLQPFFMGHRGSGLPGWNQDGLAQGDGKLLPSFPLFDAFTPGNNFTTFYFDVTFSI